MSPQGPRDSLTKRNITLDKGLTCRFSVNLDVVTAHNFDAVLAQKYFIICVPTVYGRLFPRLISCPDHKVNPEGRKSSL